MTAEPQPAMQRSARLWAVFNPNGYPWRGSIGWTRREAIAGFVAGESEAWEVWKARGWFTGRVRIVPDESPSPRTARTQP